MEFGNTMFVCAQVIIAINSVVLGEFVTGEQKNKISLRAKHGRAKHDNEVELSHSKNNELEKRPSLIGHGAANSNAKSGNCCRNGGRCILNSFCHCRKNFYGRYCQYEYKNRSCGGLKSGHFIRSDCDLCRCFDGFMYCIPRIYSGCEDEGFVDHSKKIDPFKGKDIEIIPDEIDQKSMNLRTVDAEKDYAYYYNDYGATEENTASLTRGCYINVVILLPVIVFCNLDMFGIF